MSFFKKLFGGSKKKENASFTGSETAVELIDRLMKGLVDRSQLDLAVTVREQASRDGDEISVELAGPDEALLTEDGGALLDAFQLFIKRVLQHQMPDLRANVSFDSNGYREESTRSLTDLADKLKEKALEQGRSVYIRALLPKDRKIVHQHLAKDERVRSRSVGEGLYKKVKIYPVKNASRDLAESQHAETDASDSV
jgi:spoIIIJ-associated protein